MRTMKPVIRTIAFAIVVLLAVCVAQRPFGTNSIENYRRVRGFYSEKRNALDAVYIGASNVHEFWQPAVGWMERGIAVYCLSASALPMQGVEYMVRDARKTQPGALYIFNLNNFKSKQPNVRMSSLHWVLDYMPFSINKVNFINDLCDSNGLSWAERLELFFPIIRFHSRWSELDSWAYGNWDQRYKYYQTSARFSNKIYDISGRYSIYSGREELGEGVQRVFNQLLDYLDREHVNALFVKMPQLMDEEAAMRMNTMEDMLADRGYPCLDLTDRVEEIGLDLRRDYFDNNHTNIHGAWKVTKYIADYLVEHYHFADKRGQADYALWDQSAETFDAVVDAKLLPFERAIAPRVALEAPELGNPTIEGLSVRLTWRASEGAEGYEIYRKRESRDDKRWRLLATVAGDVSSFVDDDLEGDTKYSYCMVAFSSQDGRRAYGDCDGIGVSVQTPPTEGDDAEGGDEE